MLSSAQLLLSLGLREFHAAGAPDRGNNDARGDTSEIGHLALAVGPARAGVENSPVLTDAA
jgi:hypothetical protein